jgi:ribosomal protein S27E
MVRDAERAKCMQLLVIFFVQEPQGKRKSKFINLYSPDGQARDIILLKGQLHVQCHHCTYLHA